MPLTTPTSTGTRTNRGERPQLTDEVLSGDDVEEAGNGHHHHGGDDSGQVHVSGPEQDQDERRGDVGHDADEEDGQRDSETRPHSAANLVADVPAVVRLPEAEGELAHRLREHDGVRHPFEPGRLPVPHQGLVVAMHLLPLLDGFGRHVLHAQVDARHIVRGVDHEKQHEGEQIHADEDGNGVEHPPHDIGNHRGARVSCRR
jgi:hypothetical protein